MLLTDFDDVVLLRIASHLRLNDLINLKKTCRRFKAISETKFKKFTTINLCYYAWFCEDANTFLGYREHPACIKRVLSYIGPYLSVLQVDGDASYSYVSFEIERYCTNVKSLLWGDKFDDLDKPACLQAFLTWINNLQLESLTLLTDKPLQSKLFHGITTLNELIMDCNFSDETLVTELYEILEHNVNIETLYIELTRNFNFEIFGKLTNLRHLGIRATCTEDITKIVPFLKMHGVTKLQVEILFEHYELTPDESDEDDFDEIPDELNESLKRLAETKTLKELSLKPLKMILFDDLNTSTLHTLRFFELTSLHLQCNLDYDRRYEIIANTQPNLTNLDLDYCEMHLDVIVYLIENLKKLEKFQVSLPATVEKEFLDEDLLIGISQQSTERPALTVKLRQSDDFHSHVAVKFYFKERVHKVATFTGKETFQCVRYENYRLWCV